MHYYNKACHLPILVVIHQRKKFMVSHNFFSLLPFIILTLIFPTFLDESSFNHSKQLSEDALERKKRIDKAKRSERNKMYYEKRKETILQKRKVHYESHAESILERKKGHYESHAESILERRKGHYESHAESILERKKGHYESHAESILQKKREYYENNADSIRKRKKEYHERNAEEILQKKRISYQKRKTTSETKMNISEHLDQATDEPTDESIAPEAIGREEPEQPIPIHTINNKTEIKSTPMGDITESLLTKHNATIHNIPIIKKTIFNRTSLLKINKFSNVLSA